MLISSRSSMPSVHIEAVYRRRDKASECRAALGCLAIHLPRLRDLDRILKSLLIPNGEYSVAQTFMQVCLHSRGSKAA